MAHALLPVAQFSSCRRSFFRCMLASNGIPSLWRRYLMVASRPSGNGCLVGLRRRPVARRHGDEEHPKHPSPQVRSPTSQRFSFDLDNCPRKFCHRGWQHLVDQRTSCWFLIGGTMRSQCMAQSPRPRWALSCAEGASGCLVAVGRHTFVRLDATTRNQFLFLVLLCSSHPTMFP